MACGVAFASGECVLRGPCGGGKIRFHAFAVVLGTGRVGLGGRAMCFSLWGARGVAANAGLRGCGGHWG